MDVAVAVQVARAEQLHLEQTWLAWLFWVEMVLDSFRGDDSVEGG